MKSINEELKTKRPQKDLHIQKGLENSQNEPEKLQNKLFKMQKELKCFTRNSKTIQKGLNIQ